MVGAVAHHPRAFGDQHDDEVSAPADQGLAAATSELVDPESVAVSRRRSVDAPLRNHGKLNFGTRSEVVGRR